jgi:hypothetical protein
LSLVVVVACASTREVSKVKYTQTSCVDCGIAGDGERYELPDAERDPTPVSASGKEPEPTCRLVAELMASLEVGNYAAPEERAPRVATHERHCVALRPSRDARKCFVDAYDAGTMERCIPALFR